MVDDRYVRNEDRLPWLETVDVEDEESSAPIIRIIALVLVGLAVLAGIVLAVLTFRGRDTSGTGQLIPAATTAYKVRPEEPGGLKVEGEGDSAIATSDGKAAGTGAIDLGAVPETPIDTARARPATPAANDEGSRSAIVDVPARSGKLVATAPLTSSRPAGQGAATGGTLVQLGAYPSEAVANESWGRFAKRFAYLADLPKAVQPVARGGKTLYRLRVDAGNANQAAELCGRLRVAGEACFVAG